MTPFLLPTQHCVVRGITSAHALPLFELKFKHLVSYLLLRIAKSQSIANLLSIVFFVSLLKGGHRLETSNGSEYT